MHRKTNGTIGEWRKYLKGVKSGELKEIPKYLGEKKSEICK